MLKPDDNRKELIPNLMLDNYTDLPGLSLDELRKTVYNLRVTSSAYMKSEPEERLAIKASFVHSISDASSIIALFSGLDDVYFFLKNRDSRFMGANPLQLGKLGLATEADIVGKSDYDFFPSHMISLYHADDQRVMEAGVPIRRRIEPVANPDGSVSWHITSKFPLFDAAGTCVGLAGIMRDLDRDARSWQPHRRMGNVMDHIDLHFAESLTIRDLAIVAGLSISQFDRRFRDAFGQTPSRFLIRYRLTRASQRLVDSDYTISRIAQEVGFYDHSHFTREFRNMFGTSPGRYRKEHTEQG